MIRFLQQLAYGFVLLGLVAGCNSVFSKKKKTKYGVHDHPFFIDYCLGAAGQKIAENPAIVSTFEEPLEDACRDKRLEMLKKKSPRLYSYALEHEEASSVDLWLLAELERKFGQIQDASVILIGAQQGRLAALLVDIYQVEKITVIDLPACLELAKWKLRDRNLQSFQWVSPQQIENGIQEADFLLSNSIVSRLSRHWQDLFIRKVFSKVKGGCILYKPTPRHWGVKTWDRYQFLERLKKRCLVEEPFVEGLTANFDSLMLFSSRKSFIKMKGP